VAMDFTAPATTAGTTDGTTTPEIMAGTMDGTTTAATTAPAMVAIMAGTLVGTMAAATTAGIKAGTTAADGAIMMEITMAGATALPMRTAIMESPRIIRLPTPGIIRGLVKITIGIEHSAMVRGIGATAWMPTTSVTTTAAGITPAQTIP